MPKPIGASAAAIQSHYDAGNEFYQLWLDDSRTYSCAMWDGATSTLEAAQRRKHDWHIVESGAAGGRRVLDIGCGWGGTLKRLVTDYGVERAVGLTLSEAQRKHVESLQLPGVEVRLESWAEHAPDEAYDAIISIGAFEHFARFGISPREKIESYRAHFAACHELLAPGGCMTLQTMAYGDIPRDRAYAEPFIAEAIFPESDLPRLADIAEACEGDFEIRTLRNDREDYARTYRAWFNGLRAHRESAVALVGEETVQRYERYLRTFCYSFGMGAFHLLRMVLRRIDIRRYQRR